MKYLALVLLAGIFIGEFSAAPAYADSPSLTGTWNVQQTGLNGTTTQIVKIQQSGAGLVGSGGSNGNGFTGTFVSESQINGTWHGSGGAGWLTVYASANGHSFNGSWGYNGRKENGTFVGQKVLPPSPITAVGTWNVTAAGKTGNAFVGEMKCTESGPSVLCRAGSMVINGKFRTKDKVRATWSNGSKSGWFSFWFNGDNNSFNGSWGVGKDSSPASGRVVGQRSLG